MAFKDREEQKAYYIKNREKIISYSSMYRELHREKILSYLRDYRGSNKEKTRVYNKNRLMVDINFKLRCNLRKRISQALKNNYKSKSTTELLGCSINELRTWIESQFQDGMSWDNYGSWHIDHCYPCAAFDLTQPYEQKICFNWLNLQPLWARENIQKSDKINI
jgi:hypothetical protein